MDSSTTSKEDVNKSLFLSGDGSPLRNNQKVQCLVDNA